jgi:hypothetical protein
LWPAPGPDLLRNFQRSRNFSDDFGSYLGSRSLLPFPVFAHSPLQKIRIELGRDGTDER